MDDLQKFPDKEERAKRFWEVVKAFNENLNQIFGAEHVDKEVNIRTLGKDTTKIQIRINIEDEGP